MNCCLCRNHHRRNCQYPNCPDTALRGEKEEEKKVKTGIERIAEERKRQIEVEGWDTKHDSTGNSDGQLAKAAACYALGELEDDPFSMTIRYWPWAWGWWKPTPEDRIRELEKAGALIAAEIDRLQNALEEECGKKE